MSIINGNALMFGKRSSDGGAIFAAISVTYPEGSTCIATNGTQTLTASNTNGEYIFSISEPASLPETWTISCTNGTDSDSKTVSINMYGQTEEIELNYLIIGETLNDTTWGNISKVSIAGTGDTYWDVGDCKAVTLNGKIGDYLTLSNTTLYVFILDFNHPINKTTADNNIIWGGFKTALTNGKDIALCDSGYDSGHTSGKYLNINHVQVNSTVNNTNYGGWKGCDFRYDILGATSTRPNPYSSTSKSTSTVGYDATQTTIDTPVADTLMAALPNDLRAVLRLWNRYIDFVGNKSNTDANCSTPTIDAISLLAEFEIFGTRTHANQYEQNHQKQISYYSASNSKVKYRHNATGTACKWWTASPVVTSARSCCHVSNAGAVSSYYTHYSYGLAPAFRT